MSVFGPLEFSAHDTVHDVDFDIDRSSHKKSIPDENEVTPLYSPEEHAARPNMFKEMNGELENLAPFKPARILTEKIEGVAEKLHTCNSEISFCKKGEKRCKVCEMKLKAVEAVNGKIQRRFTRNELEKEMLVACVSEAKTLKEAQACKPRS